MLNNNCSKAHVSHALMFSSFLYNFNMSWILLFKFSFHVTTLEEVAIIFSNALIAYAVPNALE